MHKSSATKLALILFSLVASVSAFAQGITVPRPSPAATVTQTVGISTVSINYSRPFVNGREIWGKLVPYGWNKQGFGLGNDAPWRAGANENTVIKFSDDVVVQGQKVPAGAYGLTFVINKDNTGEVVLSKDSRSWGSFFYDPKLDQMRASIQVRDMPASTEMLTYDFISTTKNSAELVLNWEKKQFPVKIEYPTDELVVANAGEELKSVTGFNWQGYASAANYTLQNKLHLDQGLVWIDKAIAQNKSFGTLNIKAGILRQQGNTADADKIMNDALPLASEVELNAYGYQLVAQGQMDKAIEIFVLNTQRHPESANTWDSLGEAYVTKGDKTNAITNFKKSLSLNPQPAVKANSEKFLKQLGAM